MEFSDLAQKFSTSRENQQKAIFNTLFIVGNRLQTIFDNHNPDISLKQFMLLSIVRQSKEQLTFTQLGNLLGCSRQNIKKIAAVLEKKGFVNIQPNTNDTRALSISPTEKLNAYFESEFIKYQEELPFLFELYSDEEVRTLFYLLMKLHQGTDCLQEKITITERNEPDE